MNVLRLVKPANDETVAVLQSLLAKAKRGEIKGVVLCYRTSEGNEDAAFTGCYRARMADAAYATMRLSWRLTQAQDLPLP